MILAASQSENTLALAPLRDVITHVLTAAPKIVAAAPKRAWTTAQDGVDAVSSSMKELLTMKGPWDAQHAAAREAATREVIEMRQSPKLQKRSHRFEHCESSMVLEQLNYAKAESTTPEVKSLFDVVGIPEVAFAPLEKSVCRLYSPTPSSEDQNMEAPRSPVVAPAASTTYRATPAAPASSRSSASAKKPVGSGMNVTMSCEWEGDFDVAPPTASTGLFPDLHDFDEF